MKIQLQTVLALLMLLVGTSLNTYAGDDPNIKGAVREGIQKAMQKHVSSHVVKDEYIIYDAVDNKLLNLKFEKLHAGIVKKGNLYVSCADFSDGNTNKFDLDFLVTEDKGKYKVIQGLVHSKNGEKRKYHIE